MLDNFFDIVWPNFKDLEYLRHEKFDAFKIQDLTINLKIDYLTKSKGEVIVVSDWKTGKENTYGGVTELQMATYILWVMSHYQKPPEEIRGEFIYLSSGKMRPFQMGFDQLEKIKNFIVEDSTKLNKSYEFSNFTTDPSKEKCHSCQFGSICSDSKITEDKDQSMLDQDDNLKELLADIE